MASPCTLFCSSSSDTHAATAARQDTAIEESRRPNPTLIPARTRQHRSRGTGHAVRHDLWINQTHVPLGVGFPTRLQKRAGHGAKPAIRGCASWPSPRAAGHSWLRVQSRRSRSASAAMFGLKIVIGYSASVFTIRTAIGLFGWCADLYAIERDGDAESEHGFE